MKAEELYQLLLSDQRGWASTRGHVGKHASRSATLDQLDKIHSYNYIFNPSPWELKCISTLYIQGYINDIPV